MNVVSTSPYIFGVIICQLDVEMIMIFTKNLL